MCVCVLRKKFVVKFLFFSCMRGRKKRFLFAFFLVVVSFFFVFGCFFCLFLFTSNHKQTEEGFRFVSSFPNEDDDDDTTDESF